MFRTPESPGGASPAYQPLSHFTPRADMNGLGNLPNVNEASTSNFNFRALWASLPRYRSHTSHEWEDMASALDWTGYIDKDECVFPVGTGQYGEVYKAVW